MSLFSYVVRYDSGFAPNPFYGYCTLATCKPRIRRSAQIGDWVLGTGSASQAVQREGHIVYAMRVSEILSFQEFDADPRFEKKKPYRRGSRKQSCGDNIYYQIDGLWRQRDSFHTNQDGSQNARHTLRDTSVNRVLISDDFVFFGGDGPKIPGAVRHFDGIDLCKAGVGEKKFSDPHLVNHFVDWVRTQPRGYRRPPFEWLQIRKARG